MSSCTRNLDGTANGIDIQLLPRKRKKKQRKKEHLKPVVSTGCRLEKGKRGRVKLEAKTEWTGIAYRDVGNIPSERLRKIKIGRK